MRKTFGLEIVIFFFLICREVRIFSYLCSLKALVRPK